MRIADWFGKACHKLRIIILIADIDFKYDKVVMQLFTELLIFIQKFIQHMTPATPVTADLYQDAAMCIPCQFKGGTTVSKGIPRRIIALAVYRE